MVQIPLTLDDISLWLAVTTFVLQATLVFLNPQFGHTKIYIDRGKLKKVSNIISIIFIIAIILKVYQIIITA
jgi:hypothetical protein